MVNGRLGVLSRGIVLTGESEEAAGPRPKVSTGFLSLFHTNMDRMDITCGNLLSMYISWIYIHSYHCYIHIYIHIMTMDIYGYNMGRMDTLFNGYNGYMRYLIPI